MTSELLRQVRVLDPLSESDRIADVWILDHRIKAVEETITDIPADTQITEGAGLILGAGLIDLYSQSGEPGFESRETLDSVMQSALAGGFTRLTLLPNQDPVLDQPGGMEWIRSQIQLRRTAQGPQVYQWGALTIGAKGEQMVELAELAEAGVVGFTDGQPLSNGALLRRSLEYSQPLGKPMALWCCDRQLTGDGVVREGIESLRLGLPGSPVMAETAPLAAVLECIAETGTPVHLMRLSTARGVELVQAAKAQGLPITASTTWMHLLLDVRDVYSYDPALHLDPPLGNPDDRAALRWGVREGIIDAIAIDHSPYTYEEKTVAFAEAPPGAIGLELALPLLWQHLVESGEWSALTLWRSLSTHPARCLKQPAPAIAVGQPAELTLFDPRQTWRATPQTLRSKAHNTPWLGQSITGRVIKTWALPASSEG